MDSPPTVLDADQSRACSFIISAIRETSGPRYFCITGLAGSGKTYVLKRILDELSDTKQITLCWAGVAARHLSCDARTVMSYCGLQYDSSGVPGDNAFMRCPSVLTQKIVEGLRLRRLQDIVSDRAVLVLDELQAIQGSVFDALSNAFKRLRSGKPDCDLPFGGMPVIVTGDPCQLGRVAFRESVTYTEAEFPTKPCWDSDTWRAMDPAIFYLSTFHRGQDGGFFQMLSEIRKTSDNEEGIPQFSAASKSALQRIRDRDAGLKAPRFPHTILCLTNGEADIHNGKHLEDLDGDEVVITAIDTETPLMPENFDYEQVSKLGYKPSLMLKRGCRVMSTVNHPHLHYVNGLQGTVSDIILAEGQTPKVYVIFDGENRPKEVKREKYILTQSDGEVVFAREQIPLMLAAAMTVHKSVGLTLSGVWAHLPFKGCPKSRNEDIAAYWKQQWLRGCMYTLLSRVGSQDHIKVHPLRRGDVMPIFWMDSQATAFDRHCQSRSLLKTFNASPSSPSVLDTGPGIASEILRRISDVPAQLKAAATELTTGLSKEFQANANLSLLFSHYSTLHAQRIQMGQPSVHMVAHAMSRPNVRTSVEQLPTDLQWGFYEQLDQRLNVERDVVDDSDILTIAQNMRAPQDYPSTQQSNLSETEEPASELSDAAGDNLPHRARDLEELNDAPPRGLEYI